MNGTKKLKILLSAFSCAPGRGSEPAVGWNIARTLAKQHEVWILTHQGDHYEALQRELEENPSPNLRVIFHRVSSRVKIHKIGRLGEQVNYYLWQVGAYFAAKRLHEQENFDLMQHVTFVRYWTPSFLSLLDVPFVWGPVGGGESSPKSFVSEFGRGGKTFNFLRETARRVGEFDPFVRAAARKSAKIIAVTEETAARIKKLCAEKSGAGKVEVISQCALNEEELDYFGRTGAPPEDAKIRFISVGRLLHWKGFYLGLRAFAEAQIENAEYWIVGHGPDEKRLKALAEQLGISEKVNFCGAVSRRETFDILGQSHVLIHPSLHDSGSFVCLEAMAAQRPVICLDLGGPAVIVSDDCGIKIPAQNPAQATGEIAAAMKLLAGNPERRAQMGARARQRAVEFFNWEKKVEVYNRIYIEILNPAKVLIPSQQLENQLGEN